MNTMLSSFIRRSPRTTSIIGTQLRCLSGSDETFIAPIPTDLEHYTSGWHISDLDDYKKPGQYVIKTFNKISPKGLDRFPKKFYKVEPADSVGTVHTDAILLRSHKLQESEVDVSVRAIARCGAGTNNIPVARMTELGIPVFNTPGANANAVKELILCGMLLGSRRIVDGINHMKSLGEQGLAKERVEKDKAMFGGREIKGKTLAVIGLGHIGSLTAIDAMALGMKIKGYDPGLSVKSALKLPREIELADSIASAVKDADYVSINIPFIKGTPDQGGTTGIIGKDVISHFKPDTVLLNFARGELVDSLAMKEFLDKGTGGKYVTDFPDDEMWDHKECIVLPHLGASTAEAEDEAAAMAVETIRDYIEHGTIRNSVNFPKTSLEARDESVIRWTVVNRNIPGVLSQITECFGKHGLNIVQQINQSRGDIAYNVIDLDPSHTEDAEEICLKDLQRELTMLEGVLSTRVIFGTPGVGYARNINGEYVV